MQMMRAAKFFPRLDQPFMDRIELVGAPGDDVALDRLFKPGPLKHRGFEDRSRRIRVVFEQLCRILAVERKIKPAVEARFIIVPARRDQRPEGLRNFQPAQIGLVVDRVAYEFEAHGVDFAGRSLDLPLDRLERKRVIGALVPIAFAVDGVEVEARAFGGRAPVVAFGTDDALHPALAAAANVTVAAMALMNAVTLNAL